MSAHFTSEGAASPAWVGSITEITDPRHQHVRAFVYQPPTIEERIRQIVSRILPNEITTQRTQILPSDQEEAILKWCELRNDYLRKNPTLEKSEDICPITQDRIYDKAELIGEGEHIFIFERSSLLIWFLHNPINPITREKISADTIKAIFSQANDAVFFSEEGFRVLQLAAEGNLDELKRYFPEKKHFVDQLHRVSKDSKALFSPLHYAIAKEKWNVVAYLINQGLDFTIVSHPENERPGKSAISMLKTKNQGLTQIILALILSDENINVEALLFFITSNEIPILFRQEVLSRHELCKHLTNKLKKDEALLIMCALMTGSFKYRSTKTDFARRLMCGSIGFNDTIDSGQMLMLASILSGLKTFDEITDLTVAKCSNLTKKETRLFYDPKIAQVRRKKVMMKTNREITKCYGLIERSRENTYIAEDPRAPKIQVFGIEDKDEFILHYGLLFRSQRGNYVIHIDYSTQTVNFEKADKVFERYRKDPEFKSIYTFMLPWHMS